MEADSKKLTYSRKDFHFSISNKHGQPKKSEFDVQFLRMWNMAMSAEVFRYSVDGVETKVLPGKYNIVTQVCFLLEFCNPGISFFPFYCQEAVPPFPEIITVYYYHTPFCEISRQE